MIDAIRFGHREQGGICITDVTKWPCDTAVVLAALDDVAGAAWDEHDVGDSSVDMIRALHRLDPARALAGLTPEFAANVARWDAEEAGT